MTILIIVESPTKAKAIQSYAGPGHQVKAYFGHIRDLPAKELGVDVAAGFKPHYIITNRKAITALEKADTIILASDPTGRAKPLPGTWRILSKKNCVDICRGSQGVIYFSVPSFALY